MQTVNVHDPIRPNITVPQHHRSQRRLNIDPTISPIGSDTDRSSIVTIQLMVQPTGTTLFR